MTEVIISNDIEDYRDCVGMILRNKSGFQIGTIVDVEHHIIAMWNRHRVVFVLDNGMKAFADETRMAKRKSIASSRMVESRSVHTPVSFGVILTDSSSDLTIGKGIYRNGAYYGTVVSRGCDCNGRYAMLNNGRKIRLENVGEDEFFTDNDNESSDEDSFI